jgi:hypothetical protein
VVLFGYSASSTTKTGCHDIAEILLKVALSTINQIKSNLLCLGIQDDRQSKTIGKPNIFCNLKVFGLK